MLRSQPSVIPLSGDALVMLERPFGQRQSHLPGWVLLSAGHRAILGFQGRLDGWVDGWNEGWEAWKERWTEGEIEGQERNGAIERRRE